MLYDRYWEKINAHFVVSILQLHHSKLKELSSFATHSKNIVQFYSTSVVLISLKMWMYCKVSEGHLRLRVIFGVDHIEVRLIPSELISTKNVGWSSYNTTFLGVLGKKIPYSFSSFDLQLRLSRWRFRVASLRAFYSPVLCLYLSNMSM